MLGGTSIAKARHCYFKLCRYKFTILKKTNEVLPLLLANYYSHLLNIVSYVLHGQYHNFPQTVQVPSNGVLLLHIDKAHFHCIYRQDLQWPPWKLRKWQSWTAFPKGKYCTVIATKTQKIVNMVQLTTHDNFFERQQKM